MGKRVTAKEKPLTPVVIGPCKATDGADVAEVINELRDRERDALVKRMVDRFLGWRLPESFSPDAGISFNPEYNVEFNAAHGKPPARHQPSGTNLFDATQAEAMVRYMLEGSPAKGLMPLCTCESARQCRGSDWAAKDGMRCSQARAPRGEGTVRFARPNESGTPDQM